MIWFHRHVKYLSTYHHVVRRLESRQRLALSFETIRFFTEIFLLPEMHILVLGLPSVCRKPHYICGIVRPGPFTLSNSNESLKNPVAFGRRFYDKSYHRRPISTDLATMRFVTSHTKIPIPRVYFTFRWLSYRYIIMDRIPGVELDDVWEDMPLDGKIAVAVQLRDYFAQLRAIPPPTSTTICSVTGGPFICTCLHADMKWRGSF